MQSKPRDKKQQRSTSNAVGLVIPCDALYQMQLLFEKTFPEPLGYGCVSPASALLWLGLPLALHRAFRACADSAESSPGSTISGYS